MMAKGSPSSTRHHAPDGAERPGRSGLGRRDAYERYVVANVDVVYRLARSRSSSAADADDLGHEALLRAYDGIDRFDGRHPTAWLRTIVRNTHDSWSSTRRLQDGGDTEPIPDVVADGTPGREETVIADDGKLALRVLVQLSEDLRAVVELVDVAGLRYREAAQELGIPLGTVISRLHCAREQMRARVERGRDGPPAGRRADPPAGFAS